MKLWVNLARHIGILSLPSLLSLGTFNFGRLVVPVLYQVGMPIYMKISDFNS
jgi:hypothetical protein